MGAEKDCVLPQHNNPGVRGSSRTGSGAAKPEAQRQVRWKTDFGRPKVCTQLWTHVSGQEQGQWCLHEAKGAYLEGEVWAWNNVWLSSVGGLHAGPRNTSVTLKREKAMADSSRSCWLSTGAAQQQVLRQAGTLLLSAVSCSCRTRQHALRQAGADLTDDGPLIWAGGAHVWCQAPSPVMGVNVSVAHKR